MWRRSCRHAPSSGLSRSRSNPDAELSRGPRRAVRPNAQLDTEAWRARPARVNRGTPASPASPSRGRAAVQVAGHTAGVVPMPAAGIAGHDPLHGLRDPRLVTIRRGGTLTDTDHQLLALWAAACAEHVLQLFEALRPADPRPRHAIEQARAWVRGEITMLSPALRRDTRCAARDLTGAARQPPMPQLRPAPSPTSPPMNSARPRTRSRLHGLPHRRARVNRPVGTSAWQREQLPEAVRELVLDDQRLRNDICWSVFDGDLTPPAGQ